MSNHVTMYVYIPACEFADQTGSIIHVHTHGFVEDLHVLILLCRGSFLLEL